MAVTLTTTGVQFATGTTQTTALTPGGTADLGTLLAVSSYNTNGTYTWTPSQPTTTPAAATWNLSGVSLSASGSSPGPYTITDASATQDWAGSMYTTESGVNVFAQATPSQTDKWWMIGLTRTPGTSYTAIEYALYFQPGGIIGIYESGVDRGTYGSYNTSFVGRVTYDGSYIRYYADIAGTRPIRVVSIANLTGLKMQAASYGGGALNNCYFGSCTQTQGTTAVVKLVGGGGGAAGYSESGGAGGYSEARIDVSAVANVTVTVGAAGTAVAYYAAAGTGGTSSFGAYCSATGGYGSNANYSHAGGVGGTGSGGNVNLQGGGGQGHCNSIGAHQGRGGGGYFGGGASWNRSTNTAVTGPAAPGAGGPGSNTDAALAGATGGIGMVIVYTYK
jgi:hypothetical protein